MAGLLAVAARHAQSRPVFNLRNGSPAFTATGDNNAARWGIDATGAASRNGEK